MEARAYPPLTSMTSGRSEVDTSRPFRSVKEAVAIFGERLLSGEVYSQRRSSSPRRPPPPTKPQYSPPSPSYSTSSSRFNHDGDEEIHIILKSMKMLRSELEETKNQIILLQNNGAQTEIAVASLNAELYKNRAKLAEMEAAAARTEERMDLKVESGRWEEDEIVVEGKYEYLPSLAAALKLAQGDCDDNVGRRVRDTKKKKKTMKVKKKPIVPLIGDLFTRKKDSQFSNSYFSVVS